MSLTALAKTQFENGLRLARGGGKALREKAWAEFERQGLPSQANEAWKYSSLKKLSTEKWTAASSSEDIPVVAANLIREWRDQFDVAVLINGQLHKKSSQLTLEAGYEFGSLTNSEIQPQVSYEDGFVSLAAAVNRGGYHLRVDAGVVFPKPLLIVHCAQGEGSWSATLNRISLG